MIQNVTKKTLQVELLNMKISSDKQHMYTLNMHISIPNIVLLKLPCLQLLLSSADHHFKQLRSRSGPNKPSVLIWIQTV